MTTRLRLEIVLTGDLEELDASGFDAIDRDDDDDGYPGGNNPILMDICQVLEEHRVIRFAAGGFGQPDWHADVSADLEMLLEELPEARRRAEAHQPFTLGFHEQTLQRTLEFEPEQGCFAVRCVSWDESSPTGWRPEPDTIRLPEHEVRALLASLAADFCRVAEAVCSALTQHPRYQQWRRDVLLDSPSAGAPA